MAQLQAASGVNRRREFSVQAQRLDPTLAMAYWGEAMTYKQPLWQSEDVASGQAALAKLQANPKVNMAKLKDWELSYIDAAQRLFAANKTQAAREQDYRSAMTALYAQFPNDADGCALAALSELSLLQSSVQVMDDGERTRVAQHVEDLLLIDCLQNYPNHVGALHYMVSFYDDVADAAKASLGRPACTGMGTHALSGDNK